jgi:hypothetical protein
MRLSRILLLSVIVTLCLAAFLGLAAVLAVRVNERLILTDLAISLFSLTCLGASLPRHRSRWRWATMGTFIASGLGLILSLGLIWDLLGFRPNELAVKAMGICITWSIALPAMSLLAMTRFSNAMRWIRLASLLLILLLATQVTVAIITELDSDLGGRIMAANAILASLGTLTLPILNKLYGSKNPTDAVSTKLEMEIICPRCRAHQTIAAGDSACSNCRLKFRLEIEEPRCPGCGYLLYQLTSPRCPECGREVPMAVGPADINA